MFLIIFLNIAANKIVDNSTHPKFKDRKSHREQLKLDEIPEYNIFERKPFTITLRDGYVINADVSINDPKKFIIICHGHGSSREGMIKYCPVYYKLGYSIVLFDERGHGDNVRTYCTMGDVESKDLLEIIDYVYTTFGDDIELALHGTSLGGATVLLASQHHPRIKFIVSDCAYSSVKNLAIDIIKSHHAPKSLILPLMNHRLKTKYHTCLENMSPVDAVKENTIPVLFIHGAKDTFILPHHCDLLYESATAYKEQVIFENGIHGHSIDSDFEKYSNVVSTFVEKVHNLPE